MAARVAIVSLASDFGCQVQMTNMEDHLLEVLAQFELVYWQLASSGHMPETFDVAVIEGAVTTQEHVETLKRIRGIADAVIVIGACAVSGGIPGLAAGKDLEPAVGCVYGDDGDIVACGRISPMPVDAVIGVDYRVLGCPIQPSEFVGVLQRALMGLSDRAPREPLCASCKVAENSCFYDCGQICLGLVTRTGCGARCVSHGRPCTGCRGLAEDANLASARSIVASYGMSSDAFDSALELYSTFQEAVR
jgi:coenzyme F420-reducing hydrogenase gamma subunit